MLVVLYGLISHMGESCRNRFYEKGFEKVSKYNYAIAPQLTTTYGTRRFVSKATFRKNTDPVFRYEVGGIEVGFSRQQIARAVNDETDSLLTLATGDIRVLQEIKRIYGEKARLVYVYIDERSLRQLVADDKKSPKETAQRLEIGRQVKDCYLHHSTLFDDVLIYGGEDSQFKLEQLHAQIDALIRRYLPEKKQALVYGDVVIPCAPEDRETYELLREVLENDGISVFDNDQLSGDADAQTAQMLDAIQQAKWVVPIHTRAFSRAAGINRAFVTKAVNNLGKRWVRIKFTSKSVQDSTEEENTYLVERRYALEHLCSAAHTIAQWLDQEDELKRYSHQVESYLKLEMYEQALNCQEKHLSLCYDSFEELLPYSVTKMMSILLAMQNAGQALETFLVALDSMATLPEQLMDLVAECCRCLEMTPSAFYEKVLEKHTYWQEETAQRHMDVLRPAYEAALERLMARSTAMGMPAYVGRTAPTADKREIARLGKQALQLFEQVVKMSPYLSRQDLKDGYQRIIDYCCEVGIRGSLPQNCYERIDTLDDMVTPKNDVSLTAENTALKVYLGKAYPESGYYDVFISYKSVNEHLARDVYHYLTSIGKVVFFAPETLHMLGNSDYTEEILKAVEHAQNMVLVGDTPGYLNADWVRKEWEHFIRVMKSDSSNRNLLVVMADQEARKLDKFPVELTEYQIIRMSEYKTQLPNYLRIGDIIR